jgi:CheY-like chemotaxis protein
MRRRILVVDDNPDGRDMIALLLTSQGFDTSVAGNGVEAWR